MGVDFILKSLDLKIHELGSLNSNLTVITSGYSCALSFKPYSMDCFMGKPFAIIIFIRVFMDK